MGRNVILAGTGFDNRASIIRRYCQVGIEAVLKREPDNPHDPNAIAVFIMVPRLFGFLGRNLQQIGYIKANTAKGLAKRMDAGLSIQANIINVYAPPDVNYPKVTLELDY
ncbi:MAG: HIRAN domain-containing protein [Desulfobaccales bacterium]